jgi:hypothetical protein
MFAVGHFGLGYLVGKTASKFLRVKLNIPLLFFASIFPDIDILFVPVLDHRGPIHSVAFLCALFVPLFVVYKKSAVVYFVAVLQHTLVGDFLTGGAQLMWPVSTDLYGLPIGTCDLISVVLELTFFVVCVAVMVKTKDVLFIFKHRPLNVFVSLILVAVLLPCVIGFHIYVPSLLLIPHIVYLVLFSSPVVTGLSAFVRRIVFGTQISQVD